MVHALFPGSGPLATPTQTHNTIRRTVDFNAISAANLGVTGQVTSGVGDGALLGLQLHLPFDGYLLPRVQLAATASGPRTIIARFRLKELLLALGAKD